MGQTPGDVCARLNELTALMQHKICNQGNAAPALPDFGKCLSPDVLRPVLPLGYGSFIALRPDGTGNGGRMPIDPSVSHFKNLGKRSYIHGKGTGMQRKLAALLFIRTLRHGKEDPYLMARCGYRLANLYIRMNEPQKPSGQHPLFRLFGAWKAPVL